MGIGFTPVNGSGSTIAVNATSANTGIGTADQGDVFKLSNNGPNECFVRVGAAAVTAVVDTDMIVRSNETVYMQVTESDDNLAAICSGAETTILHVTRGYGK